MPEASISELDLRALTCATPTRFSTSTNSRHARTQLTMPPPLLTPRAAIKTKAAELFFCPSCSIWRLSASRPSFPSPRTPSPQRQRHPISLRRSSTLASSTAINPPTDIPPRYRALHAALNDIKKVAATYISISRLQLALRSLETRDPVVRIAGG